MSIDLDLELSDEAEEMEIDLGALDEDNEDDSEDSDQIETPAEKAEEDFNPKELLDNDEEYTLSSQFDSFYKAIEIEADDIPDDLLERCIENFIISEVAAGYFITHSDIDKQLERIQAEDIETYLKQRLDDVGVSENVD